MTQNRISVMLFSNSTVRAGAEEHILQLLHGLDRTQFRLHLACTPELSDRLRQDLPDDVSLTSLTLDSAKDLQGALSLYTSVRRKQVQILHSHMFRASFFASPVGWFARVPVIIDTAHVREVWRKGWKSNFLIDRIAAHFVDHTIAVSNGIAQYLTEVKGIPTEKINVIRTAPVLSAARNVPYSRPELKQRFRFAADAVVVILAGRLEPQKGHAVLIDALPQVLSEFPTVQVVFLGEGSLRGELEALVAARGLKNKICFAGFRRDLSDWFAAADLTVLPSFYEGLPMVALESLFAGCPIVATAVDGTPEVVIDRKTGLLVPPGDVRALGEAICYMLGHREFALNTAAAGAVFVRENFSVQKLIADTTTLYLRAWQQYLQRSGRIDQKIAGSPSFERQDTSPLPIVPRH